MLDYLWRLASKYIIPRSYTDSRKLYQMKVVAKSYIFNTLTLGPLFYYQDAAAQDPIHGYGVGPINIIGNVKQLEAGYNIIHTYIHTYPQGPTCIHYAYYAYTHTCIHYYIHTFVGRDNTMNRSYVICSCTKVCKCNYASDANVQNVIKAHSPHHETYIHTYIHTYKHYTHT